MLVTFVGMVEQSPHTDAPLPCSCCMPAQAHPTKACEPVSTSRSSSASCSECRPAHVRECEGMRGVSVPARLAQPPLTCEEPWPHPQPALHRPAQVPPVQPTACAGTEAATSADGHHRNYLRHHLCCQLWCRIAAAVRAHHRSTHLAALPGPATAPCTPPCLPRWRCAGSPPLGRTLHMVVCVWEGGGGSRAASRETSAPCGSAVQLGRRPARHIARGTLLLQGGRAPTRRCAVEQQAGGDVDGTGGGEGGVAHGVDVQLEQAGGPVVSYVPHCDVSESAVGVEGKAGLGGPPTEE